MMIESIMMALSIIFFIGVAIYVACISDPTLNKKK